MIERLEFLRSGESIYEEDNVKLYLMLSDFERDKVNVDNNSWMCQMRHET